MDKQRQSWLEIQLQKNRKSFTRKIDLSVFVCTWNVEECQEIGRPRFLEEETTQKDLVVMCFQEWKEELKTEVKRQLEKNKHRIVIEKTNEGLFTLLAISTKHALFFEASSVYLKKQKTEEGSILCVGIELYNTLLGFINCRLVSGEELVTERRNEYLEEIATNKTWINSKGKKLKTKDFPVLFLTGTLNYQVILPVEKAEKINQNPSMYLQYEQLTIEKKSKRVFELFEEGEITFPPTYKPKQKILSINKASFYSSRILWKRNKNICCQQYKSIDKTKDNHQPVVGTYLVGVYKESKNKKEEITKHLVQKQDEYENKQIPKVSVSPTVVVLGDLFYLKRAFFFFIVDNVGCVMAEYSIEIKTESEWVFFDRKNGILYPSQKERIVFSICIKKRCCVLMNNEEMSPEAIVVVRIKHGGERFVHLTGRFNKSSFCVSLDTAKEKTLCMNNEDKKKFPFTPKILWRMLNHLVEGIETKDLFIKSGPKCLVYETIRCLDKETALPRATKTESGFRAVAWCVVLFFQSLPETLIPSFYTNALLYSKDFENATQIIEGLPLKNKFVFYYFVSFLEFLLSKNSTVSADCLSSLFGGILFGLEKDKKKRMKIASTLFLFIKRKK